MRARSERRILSPRSPLGAWLLGAASAVLAFVVAGRVPRGAGRPPQVPATVAPTLETAAPTIRIHPVAPIGAFSCTRLRPALENHAPFGGGPEPEARTAGMPFTISGDSDPVVFSRGAVEDWPGQAGGDALQP